VLTSDTEGYDDCEGDLLTRTREIAGPTAIIGLEIDPHCHLTDEMMAAANLIICFKEYPHTDIAARADDLFELAAQTVAGKVNPVMRDYDCRMITMYQTPNEPMRSYVDHMSALEGHDGILSVSLAHGFPWGDSPRVGTRTLVIADGDAEKAANLARDLGQKLWELRENFRLDFPDNAAGLDYAVAANDGRLFWRIFRTILGRAHQAIAPMFYAKCLIAV
jgi:microcystin degradation protein MlrC